MIRCMPPKTSRAGATEPRQDRASGAFPRGFITKTGHLATTTISYDGDGVRVKKVLPGACRGADPSETTYCPSARSGYTPPSEFNELMNGFEVVFRVIVDAGDAYRIGTYFVK